MMHSRWKTYCFLVVAITAFTNPLSAKAQSVFGKFLDRIRNPDASSHVELLLNGMDLVRVELRDDRTGRASLIGRSLVGSVGGGEQQQQQPPPIGSTPSGDGERRLYQIRLVDVWSNRKQVDCYFLGDFRDGYPWLRGELLASKGRAQYFDYILATDVWCTPGEADIVKILVEPPVNGQRQLELPVRQKSYGSVDINYAVIRFGAGAGAGAEDDDNDDENNSDINSIDRSRDVFPLTRAAMLHFDDEQMECRPILYDDRFGAGLFLGSSDYFEEVFELDLQRPNGFFAETVGFYCSDVIPPSLRNVTQTGYSAWNPEWFADGPPLDLE